MPGFKIKGSEFLLTYRICTILQKNLFNAKVNFAQILRTATANRSMIRAIAYVIKADVGEEQNFSMLLKKWDIK